MSRAKALLVLSILTVVGVGLIVAGCTVHPAYPLWDGKESVADYAKRAGIKDVQIELKLDANVSMELILIPAGKFSMGATECELVRVRIQPKEGEKNVDKGCQNESPQHQVTITKPFYMGVYHVTKGQFAAFVADSGYETIAERDGKACGWDGTTLGWISGCSWRNIGFEQTGNHPVVNISYSDAVAFCDWLTKKSGKKVRLPTEAQWEYACRSGTTTAYQWGDDPNDGKGWCNAADQTWKKQFADIPGYPAFSWDDGYVFTSPVGEFKPNAFGLYDMHGNAWQWCADCYEWYSGKMETDPTGPASEGMRVLRGGGWEDGLKFCRSAMRVGFESDGMKYDVGFRVVVSSP